MYLVLGCGDVGFSIADQLKGKNVDVTIVDKDPERVKVLKRLGYRVVEGDFSFPDILKAAGIAQAEVVMVMAPNFSTTGMALNAIDRLKKELKIDPLVIVRVSDEGDVKAAKKLGADDALPSSQLLAESAIQTAERHRGKDKEKRLRKLLDELLAERIAISRERRQASITEGGASVGNKIAIVLQTNPDPDSIASGVALKLYFKAFGADSDIVYNGEMGYAQNRALVNILGAELLDADRINFDNYFAYALVDVSSHANCALPKDKLPTIVIDHHSVPSGEIIARYKDVTLVGATSTILTNYLRSAVGEIDPATAAALATGIITDTMNLTRGVTQADFDALEYLLKRADAETLNRLQSPVFSKDMIEIFARANKASKIEAGYLVANVGEVKEKDLIPQTADFLLAREGVTTTFVYGIYGDTIRASARTDNLSLHLGQKLKEAFSDIGSAGGHPRMAGASIPLSQFKTSDKTKLKREIERAVGRRFLEVVGVVKPKAKPKRARKK